MAFTLRPAREFAAPIDPAVIAALAVALQTIARAPEGVAQSQHARSPWRAAGRSVEAFDAYDAARHEHGVRRENAR